jgi:hypothetical protein
MKFSIKGQEKLLNRGDHMDRFDFIYDRQADTRTVESSELYF